MASPAFEEASVACNRPLEGAPCCANSQAPDFFRAVALLAPVLPLPTNLCCTLRPGVFRFFNGHTVRVWPGAGGLELFRLQLQGLGGAAGQVDFCVEAPGQGDALRLPGLGSYGVASYCAAICATVAGPCGRASQSDTAADAPGEDDWIDLLCHVADMLDGSSEGGSEGGGATKQGAAAAERERHLQPQQQPGTCARRGGGGGAAASAPAEAGPCVWALVGGGSGPPATAGAGSCGGSSCYSCACPSSWHPEERLRQEEHGRRPLQHWLAAASGPAPAAAQPREGRPADLPTGAPPGSGWRGGEQPGETPARMLVNASDAGQRTPLVNANDAGQRASLVNVFRVNALLSPSRPASGEPHGHSAPRYTGGGGGGGGARESGFAGPGFGAGAGAGPRCKVGGLSSAGSGGIVLGSRGLGPSSGVLRPSSEGLGRGRWDPSAAAARAGDSWGSWGSGASGGNGGGCRTSGRSGAASGGGGGGAVLLVEPLRPGWMNAASLPWVPSEGEGGEGAGAAACDSVTGLSVWSTLAGTGDCGSWCSMWEEQEL